MTRAGLLALFAACLPGGCGLSDALQPKTVRVEFAGTVTAADGRPISGATVRSEQTYYFGQGSGIRVSVVADEGGRYRLVDTVNCGIGGKQYPHTLSAQAEGYYRKYHLSPGYALGCGSAPQAVDFVLESALPFVISYRWTPPQPVAGQSFSGTLFGDRFGPESTVWFCALPADVCHQHPPQDVAHGPAKVLAVTNASLAAGQWQLYVTNEHGISPRAAAFTVVDELQPPRPFLHRERE